jgi:hypothetical protein
MERSWFDTVELLGLDVMLAVIATLAALSALAQVLQLRRDRTTSNEAGNDFRPEQYERPVAGYAPSLTMSLTPTAAATPEPRMPDWLARWMRRNPEPDELAAQVAGSCHRAA